MPSLDFDEIVKSIKTLKIQSAETIAKASLSALESYESHLSTLTKTTYLEALHKAKQRLIQTRATEPCMRNALHYVLHDLDAKDISSLRNEFRRRLEDAKLHLSSVEQEIARIGSAKIKKGTIIFTHCHSTAVMAVFKRAKKEGKSFSVHNTETRPRFQGRTTALELLKEKIPVTHYVDAAGRSAIKQADMVLMGCDAIDAEGKCYNKIGSEMFAEIASRFDVPVYIVTDSWKFDAKTLFGFPEIIEQRNRKEVWPHAPVQIKIKNEAFEKIDPKLVTGIISELGTFKPTMFIEEIKSKYPFMFA